MIYEFKNDEKPHFTHLQDRENLCGVCFEELDFDHYIDFPSNQVKEKVYCTHCGVKYETTMGILH